MILYRHDIRTRLSTNQKPVKTVTSWVSNRSAPTGNTLTYIRQ